MSVLCRVKDLGKWVRVGVKSERDFLSCQWGNDGYTQGWPKLHLLSGLCFFLIFFPSLIREHVSVFSNLVPLTVLSVNEA